MWCVCFCLFYGSQFCGYLCFYRLIFTSVSCLFYINGAVILPYFSLLFIQCSPRVIKPELPAHHQPPWGAERLQSELSRLQNHSGGTTSPCLNIQNIWPIRSLYMTPHLQQHTKKLSVTQSQAYIILLYHILVSPTQLSFHWPNTASLSLPSIHYSLQMITFPST